MTDFLKYALPDQVWALNNHLETSDGLPVYTVLGIGEYWDIKSAQGWPADRFTFDDNYVYQSCTENDKVAAPTAYKMFTANAGKGIIWGPRQYDPGVTNPILSDSTYRRYSSCQNYDKETLGGPVASGFDGPYQKDFSGTLGVQQALKQVYLWGIGFQNAEVNWYVQGFGRVRWELWVNGAQKQVSAYNLVKPGGVPVLNFPCGTPKL